MQNDMLARLGIERPVILSPMAGGPGTPQLAAAVTEAGGLGSLGFAYLTPGQIMAEVNRTRELTDGPICVNLFAGGREPRPFDPGPMLEILDGVHAALGIDPPTVPQPAPDPFADQLEAVLEARPAAFSFTFGALDAATISRIKSRGIFVMGTATTETEGHILAESGVDAVIAQGAEAGAHRGTFAGRFEESMIPTLELTRRIAAFAPVVASGGIMDADGVRAALAAGAFAVQMGTAFLPCPESGVTPVYREALLSAKGDPTPGPSRSGKGDPTVVTRAFSGRPARGIENEFIRLLAGREDAILPFPLQNTLTRPMRAAAARLGRAGYLNLWAGQGVAFCRSLPAGDLVRELTPPRG